MNPHLAALMEAFISGTDRSKHIAQQIEGLLDELDASDDSVSELQDALASYQPGGGPLMFDEVAVLRLMKTISASY
ncbi:MAG: hypothetical protein IT461_01515 [Planctomycetes bacterium]|jgi:hypothetical protein|nr:hypothetical protein [Planctomycetota bacterium]